MYNDKVILLKREVITLIPDYMIPLDSFQKNISVINFMTAKIKMNHLYLTESMQTDCL